MQIFKDLSIYITKIVKFYILGTTFDNLGSFWRFERPNKYFDNQILEIKHVL